LLSQKGSLVFRVDSERHVVLPGDSFTNLDVVIAVEVDEINFLFVGRVPVERVEPFHSRITSQHYRRHDVSLIKHCHAFQLCPEPGQKRRLRQLGGYALVLIGG